MLEYAFHNTERQAHIAKVTTQLSDYRAKLEYLINASLDLTEGINAYISLNPNLTQQDYQAFASQVIKGKHQIRNIGAAKDMVITHMYPLVGNEAAIGLNYKQHKNQKSAALKAITVNNIVLAGPLELIQGGEGLIARKPVINHSTGKVWGLVSVVLDYQTILKESGILDELNLSIAIKGKDALGMQGATFYGNETLFNPTSVVQKINLPYGHWFISAEPKGGWKSIQITWLLWFSAALVFLIWAFILFQRFNSQVLYNRSNSDLAKSEKKFRNIFHDHDAVMLLIDKTSGQIIDANDAALKYYGYSHLQLTNKKIQEINQLNQKAIKEKRKEAARYHQNYFVFPHQLADGTIRLVEVHSSPIFVEDKTLLFSIIHDVTDRIENEKKLKLDAQVFAHSREGILVTNQNFEVISANAAFTRLTGYSENELLGKNPIRLCLHQQSRNLIKTISEGLQEQGFWKGEMLGRHKNNSAFPELLSVSKLEDESHQISHYVAIFSDITKLKQSEARLEKLAHYDSLTNLPNRLLLKSRISHSVAHVKREKTGKVGILFLDLDQFKIINDSLGHLAGDQLLIQVANRLTNRIRKKDTVARLGGDEFVVLIEKIANIEALVLIAQDLIQTVNQSFQLDNNDVSVGVSIGISVYPDDTQDTEKLLEFADAAMYKAKQSGRNRYSFYDEDITVIADRKLKITSQLKKAIENDELELYFQPQFELKNNKIYGAEALIRWNHPQEGLLIPASFIDIAEESNLIHELSKWVVRAGIMQLAQWQNHNIFINMSLNISPKDLNHPVFITEIQNWIEQTGINTQFLELEITENALMESSEHALEVLNQFRTMGISIAIDDFGTGYSSISYLKHFPISKLKIDRRFITDIAHEHSDRTITHAIINIAKSFNLQVIAEGVEDILQQRVLQDLECDLVQGYLYSRPVPIEDFTVLLESQIK